MIYRRDFLSRLLAFAAARSVQPVSAQGGLVRAVAESAAAIGAQGLLRKHPSRSITLASNSLSVILDGQDGLPFRYDFEQETLWGEDRGFPITAILCRIEPREYATLSLHVTSVERTAHNLVFRFHVPWDNQLGAQFSIRYAIADSSLVLTMEDVVEHAGFELIEVALPNLVTVREGDATGWLAQGRDGGSFVRVARAKPYRFDDDDNFGRISTQLPIGIVGEGRIGCLMEVSSFMDGTETSIVEGGGWRRAHIGTVQVHRVHGGRCYNMNDGGDAVCGVPDTPNLVVSQTSRCQLDFFKVEDPDVPWFPAAKLLRERMPFRPTTYFDDKFVYLIAGKEKTAPSPRTTFAQSARLIRDIARLTDYAPQVAYISGWVYDGQDTGYPSEDLVNAALGSYDQLMRLMSDSRRFNTDVSVNVNYDDAYKSSPEFDLEFIAREPSGAVWKSRAWDGEDSYIVGMAKYVLGGFAQRRIEKTMSRYKLRHSMLIDAMSWFTIRNDWDRKKPASGYKNLVNGKWRILEEFLKRGVFVASEQFRYPMLGKIALTVNGPEPTACPFGGRPIPLTSIIYRQAAIFGSSGDGVLRPQQDLFWNSRPGVWYEHKTDRRDICDFYYLVVLPYNKVHLLAADSYKATGSTRELKLESGSRITIDVSGTTYAVECNGATIAQNETTTCPIDENRIAFYSRAGGRLRFSMPAGWKWSEVTARQLTVNGRLPFLVRVDSGEIVVDAPVRVPVVVYASENAIPLSD